MGVRIIIAVALLGIYGCGSTTSAPTTTTTQTGGSSPNVTGTPVSIVRGSSVLTTTAYSPNPVTVAVGGSVTWVNNDTVTHTSSANGGTWNSGAIAPGGAFTMTFATAGTYPYHCTIHPGMTGTVTVQ